MLQWPKFAQWRNILNIRPKSTTNLQNSNLFNSRLINLIGSRYRPRLGEVCSVGRARVLETRRPCKCCTFFGTFPIAHHIHTHIHTHIYANTDIQARTCASVYAYTRVRALAIFFSSHIYFSITSNISRFINTKGAFILFIVRAIWKKKRKNTIRGRKRASGALPVYILIIISLSSF